MTRHILPLLAAAALILACCALFAPAFADDAVGGVHVTHHLSAATVGTSTTAPGGEDVWGVLGGLLKAFHSHDWELVAGLILMLLVMAGRGLTRLGSIPDVYVPWLTTALATVTAIGLGLAAHQTLWQILTTGIAVGFGAIGAYETVGKAAKAFTRPRIA